jgi:hypothetical protein
MRRALDRLRHRVECGASGGQTASSTNYSLASTVGQPAIGAIGIASHSLCSGFSCQAQAALAHLFLPLVRRWETDTRP